MRCLLRAAGRACGFCLVGQALYAARAFLFSSLASIISSVWESNQSVVLLVFLLKMDKAALLKCSHQSHALPLGAPGKDSSSAHANSSTLPCSRNLLMSKRGLPSFLCGTVTLMAILLCCTPRRDSYHIQHSDNWCLVRIRSNWCRCLDLRRLQETVLRLVIEERVPETEVEIKA